MSVGFRKSLFGFNSQDVIEYIDKTHKNFSKREDSLNSKIEELKLLLETSKAEQEKLEAEKSELDLKLQSFEEKYEEIERLSENIGKLYLVAQSNAQAIIKNAEDEARIAEEEAQRNISSIDEAHEALASLRAEILNTSNQFSSKVDSLISSLCDAREKISAESEENNASLENFNKVYNSIVE